MANKLLVEKLSGKYRVSGYLGIIKSYPLFVGVINYMTEYGTREVEWLKEEPSLKGLMPHEKKAVEGVRELILRNSHLETSLRDAEKTLSDMDDF